MSHSLNEIQAQSKRAARGAGLSWGMAEEAARATRWLASHDLAGPALLSQLLQQNDGLSHGQVAPTSLDGTWHATGGALCPLAAGATLNDCADRLSGERFIEMTNVSYPLLVLPSAAWAAIHINQPVRVMWKNLCIDTDGRGIWVDDPQADINCAMAETVICKRASQRQGLGKNPVSRGTVTPPVWARLDAFAQRTHAPATDISRRLGAGAGISDDA